MPKPATGEVVQKPSRPDTSVPMVAVFVVGRGNRGKSFITRVIAERAQDAGRVISVLDGDRTNPTTSQFFPEFERPEEGSDAGTQSWLEKNLQASIFSRRSCIIDLGANDTALRLSAVETDLVEFFTEFNVLPVLIHVIGSDVDDLSYLSEYERDHNEYRKVFAPSATVLCLNGGATQDQADLTRSFRPIVSHEIFRTAMARGAKTIAIPYLRQATILSQRRLLFRAMAGCDAEGNPHLGILDQHKVREWRRVVDIRLNELTEWLP